LLSYRFSPRIPPQTPFKIGYSLTCRLGYFTQVWDILFQPWENQVIPLKSVQLTLQVVNRREGYDYIDGRIKVMGLGATDGAYPETPNLTCTLSESTGSIQSKEQADNWLKTCLESHDICKAAFPTTKFLPTRLVRIYKEIDGTVHCKLCKSIGMEPTTAYATLSHCWGSKAPFTLTKSNLKACLKEIPAEKLSKVFNDAMLVALRADIKYIWIDSLCTPSFLIPFYAHLIRVRYHPRFETGLENRIIKNGRYLST
jgi:hypothetical protein